MRFSRPLWGGLATLLALGGCVYGIPSSEQLGGNPSMGVVPTAVRPEPSRNNSVAWSGECDRDEFSLTWTWSPDRVRVSTMSGQASYGPEEPFVRSMFVPAAPVMLFASCSASGATITFNILSVRRDFEDRIQIVRGEVEFSRHGELVAFYGPFETDRLSLTATERVTE